MRITIHLDEHVVAQLREQQKARGVTFESLLQDALRAGLETLADRSVRQQPPYVTKPWDAGRCLLTDVDDIAEVLATAEGEAFR